MNIEIILWPIEIIPINKNQFQIYLHIEQFYVLPFVWDAMRRKWYKILFNRKGNAQLSRR